MPRLYVFDGWSIYMYFKDHHPPHIHIIKNEQNVVFSIYGEHLNGITKGLNVNKAREIINRNQALLEYNWVQMQGMGAFKKLK